MTDTTYRMYVTVQQHNDEGFYNIIEIGQAVIGKEGLSKINNKFYNDIKKFIGDFL